MKRVLAFALAILFFNGTAVAETRIFSFIYNDWPPELEATVMAVVEGETEVVLTFAGDCTLGGESDGGAVRFARMMDANGYEYPFANLLALTSNDDLTLVNLEGVLSDRKLSKVRKKFNFIGKTDYVEILKQGSVEAVTLANNHTLDYGKSGLDDTIAALQTGNVAIVDDSYVTVLQKDGVRIGFTASVMRLNRERYQKQMEALRALGCTAFVHVMHMGEEYQASPTAVQRVTAKFLSEQGATLVVGHHPHVVQGADVIGTTLVLYSLGNAVFGGNTDPRDYDAALLQARFRFVDGQLAERQASIWPMRISSTDGRNDYQPLLLSGTDAQRVIDKMQVSSAFDLPPFVDGDGSLIYWLDER